MLKKLPMIRSLFYAALFAFTSPLLAKAPTPTPVTCETVSATLSPTLAGGTILALPAGSDCTKPIDIRNLAYNPPVTINLVGSTVTSLVFNNVSGINVVGGAAKGGRGINTGISFGGSSDFSIDGYSCDGMKICAVIVHSSDFIISEMTVTNPLSDGIDVDLSQRGLIQRLKCSGFTPAPGAHPDCFQIFDTAGEPHVSDITVRDSVATGYIQGFTVFDHNRASGYDRIRFMNNTVNTLMPQGVVLPGRCNDCLSQGNVGNALPGAQYYVQVSGDGTNGNRGGWVRPMRLPAGASGKSLADAAR